MRRRWRCREGGRLGNERGSKKKRKEQKETRTEEKKNNRKIRNPWPNESDAEPSYQRRDHAMCSPRPFDSLAGVDHLRGAGALERAWPDGPLWIWKFVSGMRRTPDEPMSFQRFRRTPVCAPSPHCQDAVKAGPAPVEPGRPWLGFVAVPAERNSLSGLGADGPSFILAELGRWS